ncbi:uroporphyrin-III C-methyltransferase/precorrin-2 dehydrogenase/sirohydrochlorin ferrochelatase [Sinomonas atrocyanea]|uniref:uroporphyrinogen-III C-methyltransferase n=1 Tax=Sinomonas atrocyanea TaxID=37927 RepID=UPI00278174BF|nr:uroporphyrinogen-III C-methyltransferase [Sinomonas atrocyanea]MDP9884654.1 uroporphyrin-III C-methyltransferase/precorrin-2 dehydrogenase/sirohydrochlorin ferrochelatase [Sinomonas atrocyanea]
MSGIDLYPTSLRLLGRDVLVVGGGKVAARRAQGLLDAGAKVTVVAPEAAHDVVRLAEAGVVAWARRGYETADLEGVWFVQTATGVPAVDARVAAEAEERRIWCVNAADHESSAAWTPATARVDDVTVAVNAGGDPRRAKALKDAVALALRTGKLPLRRRRQFAGRVALVGGGPGDTGLITVRGRTLLAEADVVVADRLGPRGLLEELGDGVRVIEVGKAPGAHTATQDEINEILVREAQAGNVVVRLKGGDPYVLGRGGEEAAFCRRHGVDVEVVPGVTSAVSVPAAAGIPVTHRGLATGFSVATGHDELTELPARPDHTIVLLMGVRRLADSAAVLRSRGLGDSTPVAIVERGWTPEQRVTIGTLGTIVDRARAVGVANPAVIVIGDVVRVSPYAPSDVAEAPLSTNRQ